MKKLSSGFLIILLFVVFCIFTVSAHAELFNRGTDINGNRLIYDSDFNITWYDYSKAPDVWLNQMNWSLTLTVSFGGNIYDDWRLPSALNSDGSGPVLDTTVLIARWGIFFMLNLGTKRVILYPTEVLSLT